MNSVWAVSIASAGCPTYALTFGGFLLFGGRAADLLGRRRLFMAGLAGSVRLEDRAQGRQIGVTGSRV